MSIEITIVGKDTADLAKAVQELAEGFGRTTSAPCGIEDALKEADLDTLVNAATRRLADAGFEMEIKSIVATEAPIAVAAAAAAAAGEEKKPRGRKPKISEEQAKETLAKAAETPLAPEVSKPEVSAPVVDKAPVPNGVDIAAPEAVDPEEIKKKCLEELNKRYMETGGDKFVFDMLKRHGGGEERLTKVRAENFVEMAKELWPAKDAFPA